MFFFLKLQYDKENMDKNSEQIKEKKKKKTVQRKSFVNKN